MTPPYRKSDYFRCEAFACGFVLHPQQVGDGGGDIGEAFPGAQVHRLYPLAQNQQPWSAVIITRSSSPRVGRKEESQLSNSVRAFA